MDNFSIIAGISQKKDELLKAKGVNSLKELNQYTADTLNELLNFDNIKHAETVLENINLYLKNEILITGKIDLPKANKVIFFDIEANPYNRHDVFLVTFVSNGIKRIFFKKKSKDFYGEIKAYLATQKNRILVSSSGNNWDYNQLNLNLSSRYKAGTPLDEYESIDLFSVINKKVKCPVGLSIKALSKFMKSPYHTDILLDYRVKPYLNQFNYPPNKAGYVISKIYQRNRYNQSFEDALIEYNVSDVKNLEFIYKELRKQINRLTSN